MVVLPIINNNLFMSSLLKQDLFDHLEVREVTLHTFYKLHIDGKRNMDFYLEDEIEGLSEYISWSEMKDYVFELIKGKKSPTYLKVVLSTTQHETQDISLDASTFFLNIVYKDEAIHCTTGTAYTTFTLDKTPEKTWDDQMTQFLISHNLIDPSLI
ncbi:MAG TPA: hypothetical protein GX707_17750 [Epulopiscium sp.]|nr:hypothetical protein [Candidatus Epulonipiscium sp.]